MLKQIKTLGMVLVIGGALLITTGCGSSVDLEGTGNDIKDAVSYEDDLQDILIDGANVYINAYNTLGSLVDFDESERLNQVNNLYNETEKSCNEILDIYKKTNWSEDSVEYKASDTLGQALNKMNESLNYLIKYKETNDYNYITQYQETVIVSKVNYDEFTKYAGELDIVFTEENNEEVETNVNNQAGKKYGYSYCDSCGVVLVKGEEYIVGDSTYLCEQCFNENE